MTQDHDHLAAAPEGSGGGALLPCPFCGHVGLDFGEGSTFRWLHYSCAGCGMGRETRVQTMGDGTPQQRREQAERDATNEWNTRSAAASPEGTAE